MLRKDRSCVCTALLTSSISGTLVLLGLALAGCIIGGKEASTITTPRPTTRPTSPVRLVVVDTDAGADDAFAILAMLQAEKMDEPFSNFVPRVVAMTTVQGNTGVQNVTRNVMATLSMAGRLDIPVFAGAQEPLLPPRATYSGYFGSDGFGDFLSPGPSPWQTSDEHAAVALVRMARELPGQLTLMCIGPLTNVALAVRLDPDFLDNLEALYILGGVAHGGGNAGPGAEFNWKADPHAAIVVLDAISPDKPAFLMPLETSTDAATTMTWRRDVLGSAGTALMRFLNRAERVSLELTGDTWSCADGLLAAFVLDSSLASGASAQRIEVLGGPGPGRGMSVVDYGNATALPANVVLVEKMDVVAFQRLLLRLLAE